MNITDLITELFCKTYDALTDATHHSRSIISISELVIIGVLQTIDMRAHQRAVCGKGGAKVRLWDAHAAG